MKKKSRPGRENTLTEKRSVDYVVGQVAGSLFPNSSSGSASLSSLFSTAPAPVPIVFVPAPKPVEKNKEDTKDPVAKSPSIKNEKKASKEKSVADQKLNDRESALLEADEEEQTRMTTEKNKKKRKAMEGLSGEDEEYIQKKRQRTAASMAEERIKLKRTVFVGNLPATCTKKKLRVLFKDQGAIESIRFRSVVRENPTMSRKLATIQRKLHPKKQSVNAYVVFKDEEAVSQALEKNGVEIEKDFHIRVDRVSKKSSHDHKRSIFVGNLPFELNEVTLRQHFEECGQVEAVRLVRDKDSGMGKGFGYVLFEVADSVQLALELDGSKLEGRAIRVKRSVKKEKVKTNATITNVEWRGGGKGFKKFPTKSDEKAKGTKHQGKERGPAKGRFHGTSGKKFPGNKTTQSPGKLPKKASFKGQMVDPSKKIKKKKGSTKKGKIGKGVHI